MRYPANRVHYHPATDVAALVAAAAVLDVVGDGAPSTLTTVAAAFVLVDSAVTATASAEGAAAAYESAAAASSADGVG